VNAALKVAIAAEHGDGYEWHHLHRKQRSAGGRHRPPPSRDNNLIAVAVLSGNRNFEGRIHPLVRANYLASPPLVVAYALAGAWTLTSHTEPLGNDPAGKPVFI